MQFPYLIPPPGGHFGPVYTDLTIGNDVFLGSILKDVVRGFDGNDFIRGGGNHDKLYGGGGRDWLFGESGHDWLFGGDDNDWLYGGIGNDFLFGGSGNDKLYGGRGDDQLFGEDGDDLLVGEGGNDILDGGAGDDTLKAVESGSHFGSYVYIGGEGDDELHGYFGADTFVFSNTHGAEFHGNDVIHNFGLVSPAVSSGRDKIDLSDTEVANFEDLLDGPLTSGATANGIYMEQFEDSARIWTSEMGWWGEGDSIELRGVDMTTLTEDDFIF